MNTGMNASASLVRQFITDTTADSFGMRTGMCTTFKVVGSKRGTNVSED